eukprot:3437729-Prymnesium_polylepis.1
MSSKVLTFRFLSGGWNVFGDFGDFGTFGIGVARGGEGGGRCCVCGRVEVVEVSGRVITDRKLRSRKIRRL